MFSTVDWSSDLGWHDMQRLGQLGLLAVALAGVTFSASLARGLAEQLAGMPRHAKLGLALVLIAGLASAFQAISTRWALIEWALMLLLVALVFLIAAARNAVPRQFDHGMIAVLSVTALAHVVMSFAAYAAAVVEHVELDTWALFGGFSNPRFFGQFQTLTLPVIVLPLLLWTGLSRRTRIAVFALSASWWMLSMANGTRGTWMGLAIATTTLAVCCPRQAGTWLRLQAMGLGLGIAAYLAFFIALPDMTGLPTALHSRLDEINSLSGRGAIWSRALDYMSAAPLLGIGPMHFAMFDNGVAAHPHSSVLQWAAEWGTPSAIVMSAIVASALAALVVSLRRAPADAPSTPLRIAVSAAVIGSAAQSLVDGVIVMPYTQMVLAVFSGWALSLHKAEAPTAGATTRTIWAVRAMLLLAFAALAYAVQPEIGGLAAREQAFHAAHPGMLLPRFWQQGWIYE